MHKHIIVHHELGIQLVIFSDESELNLIDTLSDMIVDELTEAIAE